MAHLHACMCHMQMCRCYRYDPMTIFTRAAAVARNAPHRQLEAAVPQSA
jgi:hypothetical protein